MRQTRPSTSRRSRASEAWEEAASEGYRGAEEKTRKEKEKKKNKCDLPVSRCDALSCSDSVLYAKSSVLCVRLFSAVCGTAERGKR